MNSKPSGMRKHLCLNILLSLVLGGLLGCEGFRTNYDVKPEDQATAEEREIINRTLGQISQMASRYGNQMKFDSMPILVTSESVSTHQRLGYCAWDENRNGRFIVINRENFELDKQFPRLQRVFSVLLHEIGHCYLGLHHSSELLKKPGHHLLIEVIDHIGGSQFTEEGFPLSIMYKGKSEFCERECPEGSNTISSVPEFQSYFVGQLFGGVKLLSEAELKDYKSIQWIRLEH